MTTQAVARSHLLAVEDLTRSDIEQLFERASSFASGGDVNAHSDGLSDKVLATLFFQPSTRTRLSFESAMLRLGGNWIGFADREQSRSGLNSVNETLADAARVISQYADAVVIRHPEVGAAREFAAFSTVPVINAGDGSGIGSEHPTQAVLDLFTIWEQHERIDGLQIAIVGGLHQRVCRSLLEALSLFHGVTVHLVCPPKYRLDDGKLSHLLNSGLVLDYVDDIRDLVGEVDVIYHAGISEDPREAVDPEYLLDAQTLRLAPDSLLVLHPLPRHGEIDPDVDLLPCAGYFHQAKLGVPVRMAVLERLFIPTAASETLSLHGSERTTS